MTLVVIYYVAMVFHILSCFFLIAVVLLQQGKGQDLASAFGGGGTQAAFGPRGSANVLSRATTILAGVFMVTSLTLSLVRPQQRSVLETLPVASPAPAASAPVPVSPAPPAAPAAPVSPASPAAK